MRTYADNAVDVMFYYHLHPFTSIYTNIAYQCLSYSTTPIRRILSGAAASGTPLRGQSGQRRKQLGCHCLESRGVGAGGGRLLQRGQREAEARTSHTSDVASDVTSDVTQCILVT